MYKRIAGHFFRYLGVGFALVVILYALLVTAGRELLPVIDRYQVEINTFLSEKTGMDFRLEEISGFWRGLTPLVKIEELVVDNRDGVSSALSISGITAELNLAKSATNRSAVWNELTAREIHLYLKEDEQGDWRLGDYPLGMGSGQSDLDYLFRMFYYSRLLRIDQLVLHVEFFSGARTQLYASDLRVKTRAAFTAPPRVSLSIRERIMWPRLSLKVGAILLMCKISPGLAIST